MTLIVLVHQIFKRFLSMIQLSFRFLYLELWQHHVVTITITLTVVRLVEPVNAIRSIQCFGSRKKCLWKRRCKKKNTKFQRKHPWVHGGLFLRKIHQQRPSSLVLYKMLQAYLVGWILRLVEALMELTTDMFHIWRAPNMFYVFFPVCMGWK